MNIRAVFDDGSYIEGEPIPRERTGQYSKAEIPATYNIKVTGSLGICINHISVDHMLEGKQVAIPVSKPKYWEIIYP